jgi:hypothetical protein
MWPILWATVHNSEPKTETELGLSFGTGYYNNLFENF